MTQHPLSRRTSELSLDDDWIRLVIRDENDQMHQLRGEYSTSATRRVRRALRYGRWLLASEACARIWLAADAGADDEYESVTGTA